MKRLTRALTVLIPVVLSFPALAAASGSLKVTSFPSGAEVSIDGTNTGKVTPMSVSLSEGDHVVTVQLPNSGWRADTRTVTIVAGNNDLSVTLLPAVTQGPPGPQGAQGPAGAPATVRAAASGECPTGGIVVTSGDGAVSLPVCNGAEGAKGLQGIQGIQGLQGIQGERGPEGPPGPAGAAPAIDRTTLFRWGSNLIVDIDGTPKVLGLSPVYAEVGTQTTLVGGAFQYSPGKVSLAPFAIAASNKIRDVDGTAVPDYGPDLRKWFDEAVARDPKANRTIRFGLMANNASLLVELTDCVPRSLDTDYAVLTRVVVQCGQFVSITADGGPLPSDPTQDALYLPAPPLSPSFLFGVQGAHHRVSDVSGGNPTLVAGGKGGFLIATDPLRVRTGLIDNGNLNSLVEWIVASLAADFRNYLKDVDLFSNDGKTLLQYENAFLTSIGLFDPGAMPFDVLKSLQDGFIPAPIRLGFNLVIQGNRPQ